MFSFIIDNIKALNSSKFFAGIIMLLMNVGSKYVRIELTPSQAAYLKHGLARQFLIFSVCWMGTRDIFKALVLTGVFNILANHLLHEKSPYCIIPQKWRQFEEVLDKNTDGRVSQTEISDAIQILEKARRERKKKKFLRYW